ncbi:SGNH hydrolase [Planotetraspora silvatica]|uniref:SGNH hydrolase n=1 Tax=Planotetraspora silvatica TaxID=234614 RepID=A0A8J3UMR3_9ACTN|nr:SGNH/GDSL hydrolase family protein [Planotetraspora silvatica]GII47882.1 SGNH hydrolase [Planotetraspora silvatica]
MARPVHRLSVVALALATSVIATVAVAAPFSAAEARRLDGPPSPSTSPKATPGAPPGDEHLVGTWSAATTRVATAVGGQTVRMVVRASLGGSQARVHLSNVFGLAPVTFADVHLGLQGSGAQVRAGTNRPVTFDGATSVTVPAGQSVWSDMVPGKVAGGQDLVVSVHLPAYVHGVTGHDRAYATTYMSGPGDHAAEESAKGYTYTSNQWFFVDRIAVSAASAIGSVAVLGDSLTDGTGQANDANRRWTDYLHRRLSGARKPAKLGVLNAGMAGNRILRPTVGPSGVARFERDVLSQPGVRTVVVYEGINDISRGSYGSATPLIDGYKKMIKAAHAKDLRVIGATLTPFHGFGSWTAKRERIRQQVNRWIRTGGAFDAVADFDKAVRDPRSPRRLARVYDAGDHLHMSDAGRRRLADAVVLREL